MAADNISNIIDPSVMPDLQALISKLENVETELRQINVNPITIKIDTQGTSNINQLTAAIEGQQKSIDSINATIVQNRDVTQQLTAVTNTYGESVAELSKDLAFAKSDYDATKAKIKELNAAYADGSIGVGAYVKQITAVTEENVRLKQRITETTKAIQEQTEIGVMKQMEAWDKLVQKAEDSERKLVLLEADRTKRSFEQAERRERNEVLSFTRKAQRQQEINEKLAYDSEPAAQKQAEAEVLAAEKSTFAYQALAKAKNMAYRLPALLGELALFAVLFDALGSIKKAFDELTPSEKAAADRLKEYTDSIKDLRKAQQDFIGKSATDAKMENDEAQFYIRTFGDKNTTMKAQIDNYEKLKSLLPGVVSGFTQEDVIAGKYNDTLKERANNISTWKTELAALSTVYEKQLAQINGIDQQRINAAKTGTQRDYLEGVQAQHEQAARGTQASMDLLRSKLNENAPDPKTKKDKAPNAKDLNAELEEARARYKAEQQVNQEAFIASKQTFTDKQQLDEDERGSAEAHAAEMIRIIEKWHGKVGESEKKYLARKEEVAAENLATDNKASEDEKRIADEIEKRHIEAQKEVDDLIKKGKEQRDELQKIAIEIDAIKAKSKSTSDYANGVGGILEGAGIDTGDYQEQQKQIDIQIAAKKKEGEILAANLAAAKAKGISSTDVNAAQISVDKNGEDLAKLDADKQAAADAKILEGKKELGAKMVELAKQTFDAINTIRNNQFAAEQQQIEIQQKQLQLNSQQQIAAIDATTGFAVEKDNEKAKAEAQNAAAAQALQTKSNQLQLKQAEANKQAAEAEILANTATAIVKTIATYAGIPGGFAIAAGLSAVIAAIGAAQYAAAASTPLPQFEHGGTTTTETFIAGEAGREAMITPSGEVRMSAAKASIHKAPIGTKIIPADETEKLMKYAAANVGKDGGYNAMQQIYNNDLIMREVAKIMGKEYRDSAEDIVHAIYRTAPQPKRDTSVADAIRASQKLQTKH